jgi:hypothetical protein
MLTVAAGSSTSSWQCESSILPNDMLPAVADVVPTSGQITWYLHYDSSSVDVALTGPRTTSLRSGRHADEHHFADASAVLVSDTRRWEMAVYYATEKNWACIVWLEMGFGGRPVGALSSLQGSLARLSVGSILFVVGVAACLVAMGRSDGRVMCCSSRRGIYESLE